LAHCPEQKRRAWRTQRDREAPAWDTFFENRRLVRRRRLRDDYAPTGFKGYGVTTRAVPGHNFGLSLSPADRSALIAFLKTL